MTLPTFSLPTTVKDRTRRITRERWSAEESERLRDERVLHSHLTWRQFHQLDLFPDRTLVSLQKEYHRASRAGGEIDQRSCPGPSSKGLIILQMPPASNTATGGANHHKRRRETCNDSDASQGDDGDYHCNGQIDPLQGTQPKRQDPNPSRPRTKQYKPNTESQASLEPSATSHGTIGQTGKTSKIPKRPQQDAKSLEADEPRLPSSDRGPTTRYTVSEPPSVSQSTSNVPWSTNLDTGNTPRHIVRNEHDGPENEVASLMVTIETFLAKVAMTKELLGVKIMRLEAFNREAERVLP